MGAVDFIHKAISQGRKVLVHCVAGVSRSASMCIAYLMQHHGMSLEEAKAKVKKQRPCTRPNESFMKQLKEFSTTIPGPSQRNKSLESSNFVPCAKQSTSLEGPLSRRQSTSLEDDLRTLEIELGIRAPTTGVSTTSMAPPAQSQHSMIRAQISAPPSISTASAAPSQQSIRQQIDMSKIGLGSPIPTGVRSPLVPMNMASASAGHSGAVPMKHLNGSNTTGGGKGGGFNRVLTYEGTGQHDPKGKGKGNRNTMQFGMASGRLSDSRISF